MQQRVNNNASPKSQKKLVLRCIVLFIFFTSVTCYGQWKKLANLGSPIHSIYFQESPGPPKIGFCGTGSGWGQIGGRATVWRTSDGGASWIQTGDFLGGSDINSFTFRDSLTGWFSSFGTGAGILGKTTDGGFTWFSQSDNNPRLYFGSYDIYYNHHSKRLFTTVSLDFVYYSSDEGITWIPIPDMYHDLASITFSDSLTGIITGGWEAPSLRDVSDMRTTDGGITWEHTASYTASWQPFGIKNSKTFFETRSYIIPTYGSRLQEIYRSDDVGISWKLLGSIGPASAEKYLTGTIVGDSNKLFVQSGQWDLVDPLDPLGRSVGIWTSEDQGVIWNFICGPGGMFPSRFYVKDNYVFAADEFGCLYLNTTGKANGPRLQIEKDNISRHVSAKSQEILPVDIYYSKENYYEQVDSLSITVSYNDGMVFHHDSIGAGWSLIREIVTDTNVTIILKRTDPLPPSTDSFILRTYCLAVVAKPTTGIVALDEIAFNRDMSYRDCMLTSLTKTDSLFVDIQDQCGDSILRNFITSGNIPFKIISIRPNPAQDDIELDLESSQVQNSIIEILDALGVKVLSQAKNFSSGKNIIHLDTKSLLAGMYIVRIGEASRSFVKVQ